jgi:hypothetical protein
LTPFLFDAAAPAAGETSGKQTPSFVVFGVALALMKCVSQPERLECIWLFYCYHDEVYARRQHFQGFG